MNASKKYFIKTKGKAEFRTYHLINVETFDMLDIYFSSENEVEEYVYKNSIEIVEYVETFESETNDK